MIRIRFVLLGLLVCCLFGGGSPAAANSNIVNNLPGPYLALGAENNWKWMPAAAYAPAHDRYLVVWENVWPGGHHDISGRMVSGSGQVFNEFVVYSGPYDSKQPAVVYETKYERFLVVWAYDSAGDGLDNDIFGRFIPWNGPDAGEYQFAIENSLSNTTKPRLAYAFSPDELLWPNEFLIVWKMEASPSYIAGGLLFDDKSGLALDISSGAEVRDFPDVTYNAARKEFVVVWDEDVGRDGVDLDIYAIRLNINGVPQPPGEFVVAGLAQNEQHPTVAACAQANQYLFAWQQQVNPTNPDENIFGRLMSGAGTLAQSYGLAGTTLPQRYPRAACNPPGNEYMLTWHDQYAQPLLRWGVWAEAITPAMLVRPAFEVVRPSDDRDRLYPAVAFGSQTALFVWQHARDDTSYLDIWAQIVRPHVVFVARVFK